MILRRWYGTAVLLISLTTHAAADYMNGHVTEVVDNHFSITTRFFPNVGFDVTVQTQFRCHKARLLLKALRVGDLVDVDFHSTKHRWEAVRVKIRASKKDCSARSQSQAGP
jgi:hypothetical protein